MVLLWAIVIGLVALAAWQIAEAFLARDADAKKKWGHRIKFAGTAVVYLAIAFTALVYALGGQSDSSQSSQGLSAQLMATTGGLILLVLIGLVVLAIGIAFVVRGFTRAFEKHLDLPAGTVRKGIVTFGWSATSRRASRSPSPACSSSWQPSPTTPRRPEDWMARSTRSPSCRSVR